MRGVQSCRTPKLVERLMPLPTDLRCRIRFAECELDLQTRELTNGGHTFSLQKKPFQVLVLLLGRPGQLVTREKLKERLWSSDTFVDFDQSLNKAVNRLREALQDSTSNLCLIETLPGRGYRFTAAVTVETIQQLPEPSLPESPTEPVDKASRYSESSSS